jgi:DNA invertase Pin-like site-specific DNA recombinase
MKAVIYARESSDDLKKAPPIEEQVKRCSIKIQEEGWDNIGSYEDDGYSGGDWARPYWNQLVKDARCHQFNIVVVFAQDRIARDTEQFLWFQRNLKESYVKLYSLIEGWIELDSVGDTAKHISMAMASEIFRKITSEKVRKAYATKLKIAHSKGENIQWGRKPTKLDNKQIAYLRGLGQGYRTIAKQMGCSYQTIRRVLRKPHTNS